MSLPPASREVRSRRVDAGVGRDQVESLAEETALALVYNGQSFAVMMATPADLEDFALGFSVSEGIVGSLAEVQLVDTLVTRDGISLQMHIPQARFEALATRGRSLTGRTGCGLCGTDTLAAAIRPVRRVTPSPVSPEGLPAHFAALVGAQPLNARTGAVHAAAVLDTDGVLHTREDVGRHNAIDKAIGAALRAGACMQALLVTSRASYEVVHKAAEAGIPLVAAISAPTALAVRLSEQAGLTLIGFARGDRYTLYAGA
jgi:formate dehydrogenase accessory protein FdhD